MTISYVKKYLSNLAGHVTFEYNGFPCGVDPLSLNSFYMWYGENDITVESVEEVVNTKFFDGKSLKDIWDSVTELDF